MASSSGSSHSSDEDDIYPDGFPIGIETYDPHDIGVDEADETLPPDSQWARQMDDTRTRRLQSLYPYDILDPNGIWPAPQDFPPPIGQLRTEMIQAMAAGGTSGQWEQVEFVPAWTDPDWSNRFVYTGQAGLNPVDDPQYQLYAKQGFLQTQRPALRVDDIVRSPTDAAKRYGVDPTRMDDPLYGNSGVTPTQADFNIQLAKPRVTPSNQGVRGAVGRDDHDALFDQFQAAMQGQGANATEDGFRQVLSNAAAGMNTVLGAACDAEIANALLEINNRMNRWEEREEYQRLLLGGNSTDELVQSGVWTMDRTANSDLFTPLHDFLTRDKWEVTIKRGAPGEINQDSRKVYSFPTQEGEYCVANDYFWLALQPALQLASNILNSEHPATWAWADIYKMRPCRDSREAPGMVQTMLPEHFAADVTRKDYYAVYVDEDPDEWFPEVARLKELGFNSVRWVCEILRRCLVWEFNSKYTNVYGTSQPYDHQMAFTVIDGHHPEPNRPFVIRISLSADIIWPLLIEEYSQAEKAACSFTLAATIVHELTHAIVHARCQLFQDNAMWLRFNPDWRQEVSYDMLRALQVFGYRQVWQDPIFVDSIRVVRQEQGYDFFEDETRSEEGWATENQYFGGIATSLGAGSFLPETRFITDLTIMACFNAWPALDQSIYQAIPFSMIEKFFSQAFWDQELHKWGPEAMKVWPLNAPKAVSTWNVFGWRHVQLQFGRPARRWLSEVHDRVAHDDEHSVLWNWLYQLTRIAVEPKTCMIRWLEHQKTWKQTDKSLWNLRNRCADKANAAVGYLQQLFDETNAAQNMLAPLAPIDFRIFREAFAALSSMHRALSQEVTIYQSIAVDYHRQENAQTKADVQSFYGASLRTRLDGIHSRIVNDCIQFLDLFQSVDPLVLLRLSQSQQATDLLDTGRTDLRAKFVALRDLILPVRQTFDENYQAYVFNIEDFSGVARASAQNTARRIERTARRQLRTLRGPLLNVARGWLDIIQQGDRLRHAADGSPEAAINANLTRTADYIQNITQLQQQSVANQYPAPAPNAARMLPNPLLQQNQSLPDDTMRIQRFNTAPQGQINTWQTLYAEASGYVPYQDPLTGLTRFHRTNIPDESGPLVNPTVAAQAQAQGQSLIGAFNPGAVPGPGFVNPGVQAPAPRTIAFGDLMDRMYERAQRALSNSNIPPGLGGQPGAFNSGVPALNTASANVPNANGPVSIQQASATVALRDLIDERGRQVQANPAIAGQVVPSIYNQALQGVAGPNGESLTNNNVRGADTLFGRRASQYGMAQQQLEAVIRQQALGPDPSTTLANLPAQVGGQQAPGGVAPQANLLYDAVGANAPQTFQQPQFVDPRQMQLQPQGAFSPFAPQGIFGPQPPPLP
ncbi:hypothetical protein diail_4188 [Diaporthe ilicicola]|nr:hypothetical protein diail_4188 [Diaporthe ilicicola]